MTISHSCGNTQIHVKDKYTNYRRVVLDKVAKVMSKFCGVTNPMDNVIIVSHASC